MLASLRKQAIQLPKVQPRGRTSEWTLSSRRLESAPLIFRYQPNVKNSGFQTIEVEIRTIITVTVNAS